MLTSTGTIEKLGQSAGSWATLTCLVSLLLAINLHVICIYSNTTKYMQKVVTLYIVCVYQCVIPANTHTHIRTLIHPWVITTTKIPSPITVSPVCITAFKVSYSDALALSGAVYGEGENPILVGSLNCSGEESELFRCSTLGGIRFTCTHANDAGVECVGTSSNNLKVYFFV